ncbi:MAG: copper homeostasis protein CutC [Monoraphidium minutum]|nr:MAG: copper homeostasis protein CutC [Monoraphidium minutum]
MSEKMLITVEICVDSVQGCVAAAAAGAQRVELCASLVEGGVTPSHGTIKLARRALCGGTKLIVLVRPRGGDFCYSQSELEVMLEDVRACAALGADGVVSGCLTAKGDVDEPGTRLLLAEARRLGLDFTFHRAFDLSRDLSDALEQLAALGVPRVLTSGGRATALEGAEAIAGLVRQSEGRVSVLAGGGVRAANVGELLRRSGVAEGRCQRL